MLCVQCVESYARGAANTNPTIMPERKQSDFCDLFSEYAQRGAEQDTKHWEVESVMNPLIGTPEEPGLLHLVYPMDIETMREGWGRGRSAFVRGGWEFGGRNPHVTIDEADYKRCVTLFDDLRMDNDTTVFKMVQKAFEWVRMVYHTSDAGLLLFDCRFKPKGSTPHKASNRQYGLDNRWPHTVR